MIDSLFNCYCNYLDDDFLLQFLRTKKYSNAAAFKLLENYLTAKVHYPRWFIYSDNDVLKMRELYTTGYIYPLLERDEDGRRIILIQVRKMDPTKYNSADIIRLSALIVTTLMEEHETQVAGFIAIIDYAEVSMKQISVFSITDVRDHMDCIKNATVGRIKACYSGKIKVLESTLINTFNTKPYVFFLVNLPTYAHFLVEIAKKTASEKLRSRLIFPKDIDELKTLINPALLPKEYGGTIPEEIMMAEFTKLVILNDDTLKRTMDIEIDVTKMPHHQATEVEVVGSFRKLEID